MKHTLKINHATVDYEQMHYDLAMRCAQSLLDNALRNNELDSSPSMLATDATEYIYGKFIDAMKYFAYSDPDAQIARLEAQIDSEPL